MAQQANHPLPAGLLLDDYTIVRQISHGGFSIVYLATDHAGNYVAIKEYLPNSLALRAKGELKPLITAEHRATFLYGMKCFFEEGRALAHLSHPNVIRVLNFFRANDTVYIVMAYEYGMTLQEFIQTHHGEISERFVRDVFIRLLDGLREVHSHKLLHLDIKPSNIYLRSDNTPVLIDFGAARQTLASDEPMLKPMHTSGFASPEHYGSRQDLGPWSDIYSVGATMYASIAGHAPQVANERTAKDTLVPAMLHGESKYSSRLLEIIDWCLNLNHYYRPQSVFTLQKALIKALPPAPKKVPGWFERVVDKYKGASR